MSYMNVCPVRQKARYECAIRERSFCSFYQAQNFLGRFMGVGWIFLFIFLFQILSTSCIKEHYIDQYKSLKFMIVVKKALMSVPQLLRIHQV